MLISNRVRVAMRFFLNTRMLTRIHEASCRHICNIINAQLLLMLEKIGVVNCLPVATGKAYTVVGPQRSIPGYNFISGIKLAFVIQ